MSFAVVLFGDGKSHIFNTNCRRISFLLCLKQVCHEVCGEDDQLDLANEHGECKHLFQSMEGYVSDLIAPRERLILLRVEDTAGKQDAMKFIPLLKSAFDNKDYMGMLNAAADPNTDAKTDHHAKKKQTFDLNSLILTVPVITEPTSSVVEKVSLQMSQINAKRAQFARRHRTSNNND